jgi:hypothetical protein
MGVVCLCVFAVCLILDFTKAAEAKDRFRTSAVRVVALVGVLGLLVGLLEPPIVRAVIFR